MGERRARNSKTSEQRAPGRARNRRPSRTFVSLFISLLASRRVRVAVLVAIGSYAAWAGWYRLTLVTVNAQVELFEVGAVTLGYPARDGSQISPLCGCYNELPPDAWNGIVFTGTEALVRRGGGMPFNVYHLLAPMPTRVAAYESDLFFQPIVYRIPKSAFDQDRARALSPRLASAMAGFEPARLPKSFSYIMGFSENEARSLDLGDSYRTRSLTVVSDSPLHVVFDEITPLAAYIPIDSSRVRIDITRGMHLGSARRGSIRESAPADLTSTTVDENGTRHARRAQLPIFDVLGRGVVFWVGDSNPAMHDGYGTRGFATRVSEPYVTVIVPNAPFAVRVRIGGATLKGVVEFYETSRLEKDLLSSNDPTLLSEVREKSETTVEINGIDSANVSYQRLRTNLMRDSVVIRDVVITGRYAYYLGSGEMADSGSIGRATMNFRQPPIPQSAGISVFGSLGFLRIENARGKILIGRKSQELIPSADLEFDHISGFLPKGGVFSIPFDQDRGELEPMEIYSIQSVARVNGQPAYTRWEHYAWLYDYRLLVSLAALGLSVFVFWHGNRKPSKRRG